MPSLAAVKAANAATFIGFTPVALFVGGTSGIGQASAEALARYTNGNIHIILSGRSESAANQIIAGLPKSPQSIYEFIPCDSSLMSNISASCKSLLSPDRPHPITKLNYLFLSPGFLSLSGRDDTSEGIDSKFALNFYSRWKYVMELMPLLKAAKEAGEDARVVTVLLAGRNGPIDLDDLGLSKNFSVLNRGVASATYSSLMVEEFSKRYPGMSFTHTHPGYVKTGIMKGHWALKLFGMVSSPFQTSAQDCAEWSIRPLLNPDFASGAFHIDPHADPIPREKLHVSDEAQTRLYEHLVDVVGKY